MFLTRLKEIFFTQTFLAMSFAKKLAYLGMFSAISVVVNYFSVPIGDFQLSLTVFLCFLAGALFGGVGGAIVGTVGDLVGVFLQGLAPLWFVTLNTALIGFIAGMVMTNFKFSFKGGVVVKAVIAFILILLVCTCGVNAYGFYRLYGTGKAFTLWMSENFPSVHNSYFFYILYRLVVKMQLLNSVVNYALCLVVIPVLNSVKPLKIKIE